MPQMCTLSELVEMMEPKSVLSHEAKWKLYNEAKWILQSLRIFGQYSIMLDSKMYLISSTGQNLTQKENQQP